MSISIGKEFYGQDSLIYIGDKLVSEIYSGDDLVYTTEGIEFTIDTTFLAGSVGNKNQNSKKFGLPICATGDYNFTVYWGDGASDSFFGNATNILNSALHEYAEPGIYIIKISGKFPLLRFCTGADGGYNNGYITYDFGHCLISVENISGVGLTSYNAMCKNCINLVSFRANFEEIEEKNMNETFYYCQSLTEIINNLPNNIDTAEQTFACCYKLNTIPNFPKSLQDADKMFYSCTSLTNVPKLPEGLITMHSMFMNSGLIKAPEIPSSVEIATNCFYGCKNLNDPIKIAPNCSCIHAIDMLTECTNYNQIIDLTNFTDLTYFGLSNCGCTGIKFNPQAQIGTSSSIIDYTLNLKNLQNMTGEALNEMYETLPIFVSATGNKRILNLADCPGLVDSKRLLAIKRGWTISPDSSSVYYNYLTGSDTTGTGSSLSPYKTLYKSICAVEGLLNTTKDNVITIICNAPEEYNENSFNLFQNKLNSISTNKTILLTSSNSGEIITTKNTLQCKNFQLAANSNESDVINRLTNFNGDANNLYYIDISALITKYYGSTKTNKVSDLLQNLPRVIYKSNCLEISSYPSSDYEQIDSIISNTTSGYNSPFKFSILGKSDILNKIAANSNELVLSLYTKTKLHNYQFNNGSISLSGNNVSYSTGKSNLKNANTKTQHTIFDDDEFEDYGITSNAKYKLFNVFSETNSNGKYFIDYENGKLYIYNDSSDFSGFVNIYFPGKSLKISGNISLEDIKFSFIGDSCIEIENIKNVEVKQCIFENCNGILINDSNLESDNKYDSAYKHTYNKMMLNSNKFNNVENPIIVNSDNKYCVIDFPTPRVLVNADGNSYVEDLGPIQNKFVFSNEFIDCNKISGAPCIEIQTSNCDVYDNQFNNCYGKAIEHLGVANLIHENYVNNVLIETCGGAISSLGTRTSRGTIIEKNKFSNIDGDLNTIKSGIFLQKDTGGQHVLSNEFDNTAFGIWMDGGRDNYIANNNAKNCEYSSIVVSPRYDNNTNDFTESQLNRYLLTDSNDGSINYKDNVWLKYYAVGKDKYNPLTGVNTMFTSYAALNAYCENNTIINNISTSCGNTLTFNDCINVNGITIINKTTFNLESRKNKISNNIQE